jgi:hypothetical protein
MPDLAEQNLSGTNEFTNRLNKSHLKVWIKNWKNICIKFLTI